MGNPATKNFCCPPPQTQRDLLRLARCTFRPPLITPSSPLPMSAAMRYRTSAARPVKGSRKSTPFAAQSAAERAAEAAKEHGLARVDVLVSGVGAGRESAIRALTTLGIAVGSIKDVTPIAHGGCRPRKARRG